MADQLHTGALLTHKDPKSKAFLAPLASTVHTVVHRHDRLPLDQNGLGGCTGWAVAQNKNTATMHKRRTPYLTDAHGRKFYVWATNNDPFPGGMEEQDTGSSVLAAIKGARFYGEVIGFDWSFGFEMFKLALMVKPMVVGTQWSESMFSPDRKGFVRFDPQTAGDMGHAWNVIRYNARDKYFTGLNQWWVNGRPWGIRGMFRIPEPDMRQLIDRDGEASSLRV